MDSETRHIVCFGTRSRLDWQFIGDPVMGGHSSGAVDPVDAETSLFHGDVSLANGGGFASVKADISVDLDEFSGLWLHVCGDGQRYKVGLRMTSDRNAPVYQQAFATRANEWQQIALPFSGFVATLRGKNLPHAPALSPSRIASLSLFISERQAGPFALYLRNIDAYREASIRRH